MVVWPGWDQDVTLGLERKAGAFLLAGLSPLVNSRRASSPTGDQRDQKEFVCVS
jgi:hypothetical protein